MLVFSVKSSVVFFSKQFTNENVVLPLLIRVEEGPSTDGGKLVSDHGLSFSVANNILVT